MGKTGTDRLGGSPGASTLEPLQNFKGGRGSDHFLEPALYMQL